MDYNKNLPYIIILFIGIAGLSFAGVELSKSANSNQTAQTRNETNQSGQPWQNSTGQRSGNRGNFKPLHGTISSIANQTIIMKTDDGVTKNITISDQTRIMKQDNGQRASLTVSDLKIGDEINVIADDVSQDTLTPRMIFIGTFTAPQRRSGQTGGFGGRSGGYNGSNPQSPPSDSTSGSF